MNNIEKKVFEMYTTKGIGKNEVCVMCRKNNKDLSNPLGVWFVGDNYENEKIKLLFIGKNSRGLFEDCEKFDGTVIDATKIARENLWNESWAYWSYTKEISNLVFGDDTTNHIAITNMVKCNNTDDNDDTTDDMKQNCISKQGIIKNEIEILKPTHIVFYTHTYYDMYIRDIFDQTENITSYNAKKSIGNVEMLWWNFKATIGDNIIKVLRVSHPQYKNKEDFTKEIANWVKEVV